MDAAAFNRQHRGQAELIKAGRRGAGVTIVAIVITLTATVDVDTLVAFAGPLKAGVIGDALQGVTAAEWTVLACRAGVGADFLGTGVFVIAVGGHQTAIFNGLGATCSTRA